MTLYVWIDEDGCWRCSHFCPGNETVLMIALSEGSDLSLFNRNTMEEVEVEVQ